MCKLLGHDWFYYAGQLVPLKAESVTMGKCLRCMERIAVKIDWNVSGIYDSDIAG